MTEGDLFFSDRQPVLWHEEPENSFNFPMSLLPWWFVHSGTFFPPSAGSTLIRRGFTRAAWICCQRQKSELNDPFHAVFAARPPAFGNHAGRLAADKPFTGFPRVLLITTQGRPAHLTCGQTIVCIMIPRPGSWRKGGPCLFSDKRNRSGTESADRRPIIERQLALRFRPGAFPGVARLDGNVPAWLVFTFQAASEGIFPFHPIATVKHQNITLVKNIF